VGGTRPNFHDYKREKSDKFTEFSFKKYVTEVFSQNFLSIGMTPHTAVRAENRRVISQILMDDSCLPFYLLITIHLAYYGALTINVFMFVFNRLTLPTISGRSSRPIAKKFNSA
jgi:hypothetical protein